jgi:uncharacterized protein (DUF2235 family)
MSNQLQPHEEHRSRHLLLLVDGTWVSASRMAPNEQQSNIYWLNLFLEPENKEGAQIAFYIAGIGSATKGHKWGGGALAHGLELLVEEAYVNIVANFRETDKIYIFGFSRGALIARVVAYLISEYGILKPRMIHLFGPMWDHVTGSARARVSKDAIRAECYQNVPIEILGLFDTVTGPLGRKQRELVAKILKYRRLPKNVKFALHILAMHESRLKYSPILFEDLEDDNKQHLEQLWMPGVHSDIGGGYVHDFLGNVSLKTMLDWMRDKTTLKVDEERLEELAKKIQGVLDGETKAGQVVINNELGRWWNWPFSRICLKLGWLQNRRPELKYHAYHPIVFQLHDKAVTVRSRFDTSHSYRSTGG